MGMSGNEHFAIDFFNFLALGSIKRFVRSREEYQLHQDWQDFTIDIISYDKIFKSGRMDGDNKA